MTKLFTEAGTAVSPLLSLFHFDNNANYATLLATELEKLLVNDKATVSCQTNVSQAFGSLWSWAPEHYIKPYCIQNWPVTREISNSLKFRRVESARCDMFYFGPCLELLGFARLLASSTEFSGSDFKVSPLPPPLVAVDVAYPPGSRGFLP